MSKPGHNSKVQAGPVHGDRLKSFVERIEKMEAERKAIGSDIRDIYAEAKGVGYDVKTVRWVVQERRMEASDRAERDTLRDVYQHALDTAVGLVRGGLSLREAGRITGTSKSSIHRALAVPEVSQPACPKPEDGDDGITGGEDGKAEADDDTTRGVGSREDQGQQQRESGLSDGRSAQHEETGDGADAGGGTQRLQHGVRSPAEDADPVRLTGEAPAPRSVGAVAAEPRVAPHHHHDDDDLRIPDFLRGSRTAQGRGA